MGRRSGRGVDMATRAAGRLARGSLVVALVLACGSRTGLLGGTDDTLPGDQGDGGPDDDSGNIIRRDASRDSNPGDVVSDRTLADVVSDVSLDTLPPIDVAIRPDVVRTDCPDADATLIYLLSAT